MKEFSQGSSQYTLLSSIDSTIKARIRTIEASLKTVELKMSDKKAVYHDMLPRIVEVHA
jgi:hypothetical protein